jgi:antirestriction protein ArdC
MAGITVYQIVIDRILKLLETGIAPWRKAWKASELPMNLTTKIPYRGINTWLLLSLGMPSPYWLTWNQVMHLKGRVKQEEAKNFQVVVFWKQLKVQDRNSKDEDKEKTIPLLRYYKVYNLSQVELPDAVMKRLVPVVEPVQINKIAECENIVKNYKDCPEVKFGGDRAYYANLFDRIQMPLFEDFETVEEYYSTLFHEMGHSTGAPKRLNRFNATDSHLFGSETYSKEELVAEMCASFLCAEANIETSTLENSAAYIQGWMKAIKSGDKNLVISAASRAQKAADYIMQRTNVKVEQTEEVE